MNGLTYKHILAERDELQEKLDNIEDICKSLLSWNGGIPFNNPTSQLQKSFNEDFKKLQQIIKER